MNNLILLEMKDGVCTITLNNPSKKNALSLTLLTEFEERLQNLQGNRNLRAVILQGSEGNFSVGADLFDVTGTQADQEIDDRILRVCNLLQELSVPCLAAIEGPCVGGAVSVSLGCDILVASETAFFEIPAIRLGLLYNPDFVRQLYARLGSGMLTSLLLMGKRCNAQEALQSGFVCRIVPEGLAYENTLELVRELANVPKVVAETKAMILALHHGEKDLSKWREIYLEILNTPERKVAVNQAKKRLGIN